MDWAFLAGSAAATAYQILVGTREDVFPAVVIFIIIGFGGAALMHAISN